MPRNFARYYWWCQIGGWGSIALIMIFVASISDQKETTKLLAQQLGLIVLSGIFVTHLFRWVIQKFNWLMLPIEKVMPKLVIGVLVVCIVESLLRIAIVDFFH